MVYFSLEIGILGQGKLDSLSLFSSLMQHNQVDLFVVTDLFQITLFWIQVKQA